MRSWGFLVSRRWILFAITVALLAWAAWWLGEWQFHRLEDRKQRNAIVERNEQAPPAEVGDVMPLDGEVAETDEWRIVTATGEYAVDDTIIVRYRTRDGAPGVDVVVPLVVDDGGTVLVDRGWLQTDAREVTAADVPSPPSGTVTVTGYVRRNGTGDSTAVTDQSTRAVSSEQIGEALGVELHDGFVDLASEEPAPDTSLAPPELPELDNGPHFFYGLQWWFFGVLAVVGFGYLAWDERRGGRGGRRSEGPQHPTVDREHRAAHE
ncbi:SURF1 family protein [Nocardioides aestuarii]|uniref:SURF1-like protein n=1 Tax=Nocardioides aestuarii TaxID=252231 RepID=A0ABW4TTG7_9ACTN